MSLQNTPDNAETAIIRKAKEIADAIGAHQLLDPMGSVTIVAPNMSSALQWRRRVARMNGSLFNIRWIDVQQFAQERLTAELGETKIATRPMQLAAAWVALKGVSGPLTDFVDAEEMPDRVLRAFDALELVFDDERSLVLPEVLEMYSRYLRLLGNVTPPSSIQSRFCDWLAKGQEFKFGRLILLTCGSVSVAQSRIATALVEQGVETILLDEGSEMNAQFFSLHDESDEIDWCLAQIQDASIAEAIPVHEMAIVVPGRNPYGKLLEWAAAETGVTLNGLSARTLSETAPGMALELADVPDCETWEGLIETWSKVADSANAGQESESQMIKDQLETWRSLPLLVPTVAPALAKTLRRNLLAKPVRSKFGFGDGVFVGTARDLEGLAFRRVFVLGFSNSRYPSPAVTIPLLPPGLGMTSVEDQKRAMLQNASRTESVTFSYARCDRRNGREEFPSAWVADWSDESPIEVASSIALLLRSGPRSKGACLLTRSLQDHEADDSRKRVVDGWVSGNLGTEGCVGKSLMPTGPLSPTQLETFLKCPRRWYFKHVLGLKEPEVRPTFGLSAMEMGTAIHVALKVLFEENLSNLKDPNFAWESKHDDYVLQVLKREGQAILERELLIPERAEFKRWGRRLGKVLQLDNEYRANTGAVPIMFEQSLSGFVADVEFRGFADRIDRWTDGTVNIIDYKSGSGNGIETKKLAQDPTLGGTVLQGLIYAEMVKQRQPPVAQGDVSGYGFSYWFLGGDLSKMKATLTLDEKTVQVLNRTVRTAVTMMKEGLVPMQPEDSWQGRTCVWCPFASICPGDRAAIAVKQAERATGVFADYVKLRAGGEEEEVMS